MQEHAERIENPLFTPPKHPKRDLKLERRIAELQTPEALERARQVEAQLLAGDAEEQGKALAAILEGIGDMETYRRIFGEDDPNT